MKRRWLLWLLCLLLTGCGASEAEAPSPLGQAAGIEVDTPLLTIDGREIPAWKYLYWLAADCALLAERCAEAGEPLNWTTPAPDGTTAEELVKTAALSDTALYAAVEAWAETYGCTLTEVERAELPERSVPYLTAEQSRTLAETGQQYVKLYQLYQTSGSPLAPTERELALFERESGLLAAERLLVPLNGDREAARRQASALFAQINGAEDPDTVFAALLTEHSGGVMTAADWTPTLLDAAAELDAGQFSGILEAEDGFSILRRLPTDQAALREAHFDALLRAAADSGTIQVTEAYTALRPAAFWAALTAAEGS